jgi:asparagine synthetase B (glutamine-hydrolysing)
MFVIEAYKTLRDRGPYPADQVVKDLDGSFAFVIYDSTAGSVFAALVCLMFHFDSFCQLVNTI